MSQISLTNKDLIEKIKKNGQVECVEWFMSIDTSSTKASKRAYEHTLKSTFKKYQNLNKSKTSDGRKKLENFFKDLVKFPVNTPKLQTSKCQDLPSSNIFKTVALELGSEVHQLTAQKSKLITENVALQEEVGDLKKSKTPIKKVKALKTELDGQKRLVKFLRSKIKEKNFLLKKVRLKNFRLEKKIKNVKTQNDSVTDTVVNLQRQIDEKEDTIEKFQKELDDVTAERNWLADITQDMSSEFVNFFDENENKFTAELRQCIYELLQLHVSSQNCAKVIRAVLTLVNKKVDRLPSPSTVQSMNVERLVLAQKQLGEILPNKENLTIYTDETSKFGTKYSGYHLTDSEGTMYVAGLRQLLTKSGRDTLSVFEEILRDINERSVEADLPAKKILLKITATMSDRAGTEVKFNELLEHLRAEILPELTENWETLSREDQLAASQLLNFFCGLHSLIHFAETTNKAVIEVEKGFFDGKPPVFDKSFTKSTESGSARLVRTVCKALSRGGDEKSGKFRDFSNFAEDFLLENGMQSVPLLPFHGNRFNILFETSAAVFFLREKIRQFLEGNQTNTLLKAVLHDINIDEYVAGVKALGLISRHLTGPLWNLLEDKNVHIMDMNRYYLDLVNFVNDVSMNLEAFMTGHKLVFGNSTVLKRDVIYDKLLEPWEHDDKVLMYLDVILPAIGELSKRIFKDHLPGGRWEVVTDDIRKKSRGTMKHNKFAESVFGYLDQLLRKNPNISVLASEAYIMFTSNRTTMWLDAKTDAEKEILVREAMRSVSEVRHDFKTRQAEIQRKQKELLQAKIKKAEEMEVQRVAKLQAYTDKIIFFGLWQSEDQVDSALQEIHSNKEKLDALKSQLNFRKHVLKQLPPKEEYENIFTFSKKEQGKVRQLSVDELKVKVKLLVHHAFTIPPNEAQNENVPILVSKTVKHKFSDESGGKWWKGRVISQVPGYPAWYNILYENDPAVYSYKLIEDWKDGNLKIIVSK